MSRCSTCGGKAGGRGLTSPLRAWKTSSLAGFDATWTLVNNLRRRCLASSVRTSVLLFIYCSLQSVFLPQLWIYAAGRADIVSQSRFKHLSGHYCHAGFPLSSSPPSVQLREALPPWTLACVRAARPKCVPGASSPTNPRLLSAPLRRTSASAIPRG